jgi:RNA polymerase sigma-70 factor (ECF subfamily)
MAMRFALSLCRRLRLPPHEAEDFCQELLTDLLARLHAFDPAQGELGAFALICFRHRVAELTHHIHRQRAQSYPASLDEPRPGGFTLGETLAESDGYSAWVGQQVNAFAAVERRIDLEHANVVLTKDDVALCAALVRGDCNPARHAGLSRTTAFRRLQEIRLRLRAAGIASAA